MYQFLKVLTSILFLTTVFVSQVYATVEISAIEKKLINTNIQCSVNEHPFNRLSMVDININKGILSVWLGPAYKTFKIKDVLFKTVIDKLSCDEGKILRYIDEVGNKIYLCESDEYFKPKFFIFKGIANIASPGDFTFNDCMKL